jgi:hypothetical protein
MFAYKGFYEKIMDLMELEEDFYFEQKFCGIYEELLEVHRFIEKANNFENDRVKDLMQQLMLASLGGKVFRPKWESVVDAHHSTSTFPDQRLALNVEVVHPRVRRYNG